MFCHDIYDKYLINPTTLMRTKITILGTAVSLGLCASSYAATFIFNGGNLELGANWTNSDDGTTGNLPGDGDTATIAVNGNIAGNNQVGGFESAVITQTAGTITAPGINLFRSGSTGSPPTYNLLGGTLDLGAGLLNANGSNFNLLGGNVDFGGRFISNGATGNLTIGGDVIISTNNAVDIDISMLTGVFDIASNWTGSFTSGTTSNQSQWIAELVNNTGNGSVTVDGTVLTAANFANFFVVTENVGGGSTLTTVPEPSSAALLGLGGLALILRRRK